MRVAVFASGSGSNFQSLVDSSNDGSIDAEIVLCVSNLESAGVLVRARKEHIETLFIRSDQFKKEGEFSKSLLDNLRHNEVDLVALAGYMKKIPSLIIQAFPNRIINIHPALLPDFGGKGMYGAYVHRAVIDSGATLSGATVHIVDEEYDTGTILVQRSVPVLKADTPKSLAARVLKVEHQIYPEAIRLLVRDELQP